VQGVSPPARVAGIGAECAVEQSDEGAEVLIAGLERDLGDRLTGGYPQAASMTRTMSVIFILARQS